MPETTVLVDLQSCRGYPSVTLLRSTTPGRSIDPEDATLLVDLAEFAHWRLTGEVDDEVRDDELIEAVMTKRGAVVVVPDGDLLEHGRVAAVLRY